MNFSALAEVQIYNLLISSHKLYLTTNENLSIGDSAC